jgi:hypothetical protein
VTSSSLASLGFGTHTLLQGISNGKEVDKEKSGKVTVKSLGQYSKEKTTEISTKLGHPQTPFIINFGRDNPLFTEPLAKRLSSRKVSIRDPYFQVFTNWIPANSLPE